MLLKFYLMDIFVPSGRKIAEFVKATTREEIEIDISGTQIVNVLNMFESPEIGESLITLQLGAVGDGPSLDKLSKYLDTPHAALGGNIAIYAISTLKLKNQIYIHQSRNLEKSLTAQLVQILSKAGLLQPSLVS